MRADSAINTVDNINRWLSTLRSYEMTYPEIAALCGLQKAETIFTWARGRNATTRENWQRLELATELGEAVVTALGGSHQLGHVSQFFIARLKPLRGATPTEIVFRDGRKARLDLLLAVEHFADDVKKGYLSLPSSLDRSNPDLRSSKNSEERDSRAVRAAILSLEKVFLTAKEISLLIGGDERRISLLRRQQVNRVTFLEKQQLEQAAAAAQVLSAYYRPEQIREMLLGHNQYDLSGSQSFVSLIASQCSDRVDRTQVALRTKELLSAWIRRGKVRR